MTKVQIIDNSSKTECWVCKEEKNNFNCIVCNGTKIWKEDNYILITEHQGQKIAFQVDQMGK